MNISDLPTQPYPVIRPRLSLPTTQSGRAPVSQPKQYRGAKLLLQIATGIIAMALAALAYLWLEPWPVYRYVAIAIIIIVWSNLAMAIRLKKPLDQMETQMIQAVVLESPALTQDTVSYLRTVKASLKRHEI